MTQSLLLLLIGFATITVSSARIQKRIINGDVAGYVQFPWMVSMRVTTTSSHTCGGGLVTPEHVVTAAHCVADDEPTPVLPSARFIVSGHLSNIEGGRVTAVSEVRIHPEYTPSTSWRNDIAILKLATPIPFTATEQPIPIPTADVGVQPCVISGWGIVHSNRSVLTSLQNDLNIPCARLDTLLSAVLLLLKKIIRQNKIPVLDSRQNDSNMESRCAHEVFESFYQEFPANGLPSQLQTAVQNTMTWETCIQSWNSTMIFDSTLCAGAERGVGVCSGDSGSPLICNGELAGIASWVNPCGNGFPDAYARAFYFRDWMLNNTADLSALGQVYAAEALEARKSLY